MNERQKRSGIWKPIALTVGAAFAGALASMAAADAQDDDMFRADEAGMPPMEAQAEAACGEGQCGDVGREARQADSAEDEQAPPSGDAAPTP